MQTPSERIEDLINSIQSTLTYVRRNRETISRDHIERELQFMLIALKPLVSISDVALPPCAKCGHDPKYCGKCGAHRP